MAQIKTKGGSRRAETLVALSLLAATTAVVLSTCSHPAAGQGSQWDKLTVAQNPATTRVRKDRSKGPRFFYKRKKSTTYETRRARYHVPARGGVRAVFSPSPESRTPPASTDSFSVRALMITTPYDGAFAMKALPPVDDPMPVPMPPPIVVVPWTETQEFKEMVAGAVFAAMVASVFYVAKGGLDATARA